MYKFKIYNLVPLPSNFEAEYKLDVDGKDIIIITKLGNVSGIIDHKTHSVYIIIIIDETWKNEIIR